MRPYILAASTEQGQQTLELALYGVLDGDLLDESSVSTAELVAQIRASRPRQISVRINSVGGSLFGALALYNALVEHPAQVTCVVEGLAASAAAVVAMSGKTIMQRGTMMMIHNPQAATVGDANDHRKTADVLDKARDSIAPIYTRKTGLTDAAIKQLLDAETWMTADEALARRFADEIGGVNGKGENPAVAAQGDFVVVAGVVFPRNRVPSQLIARPTAAERAEAHAIGHVVRAINTRRDRGL